ncbi:MAG: DUF1559 domain-containing protein, partial [Planctomycetales bacterium]
MIAIIAILMTLLLAAVQQIRSRAQAVQCANHLKNLLLAVHNFESVDGRLPGKTSALPGRFSVHVELLPYLELQAMHDLVDFDVDRPTITNVFPDIREFKSEDTHLSHLRLMKMKVEAFNCPTDSGWLNGVNNYCPVVTAEGATGFGNLTIIGWIPADNETTYPLTGPRPEAFRRRLNPSSLANLLDGTGQTDCLVEGVRGLLAVARRTKLNQSFPGGMDAS